MFNRYLGTCCHEGYTFDCTHINRKCFCDGMKQLLWYLLVGSRGGETRCRILDCILQEPCNAHQLSIKLHLDYKTIKHHVDILEKNNLLASVNKGNYGAVYFVSPLFESEKVVYNEIRAKFGRDLGKAT